MLGESASSCGTPGGMQQGGSLQTWAIVTLYQQMFVLAGIMSPRSPRWWANRHSRPFRSSDSTGSSSSSSKSLSASLSLAEHGSSSALNNSVFTDSMEQCPVKTMMHRGYVGNWCSLPGTCLEIGSFWNRNRPRTLRASLYNFQN